MFKAEDWGQYVPLKRWYLPKNPRYYNEKY